MNGKVDAEREQSSTLAGVWEAYLDWAAFSRERKPRLFFWRRMVLGLGLAGAVFETLSPSFGTVRSAGGGQWPVLGGGWSAGRKAPATGAGVPTASG